MEDKGKAENRQARCGAGWRYLTHILLGLVLGESGAVLHIMPWNEPVHWVNICVMALLFIYFLVYSLLGYSLLSISLAIIIIMICNIGSFNLIFYLQHERWDLDFILTPAYLFAAYLGIFVLSRLIVRSIRYLCRKKVGESINT